MFATMKEKSGASRAGTPAGGLDAKFARLEAAMQNIEDRMMGRKSIRMDGNKQKKIQEAVANLQALLN